MGCLHGMSEAAHQLPPPSASLQLTRAEFLLGPARNHPGPTPRHRPTPPNPYKLLRLFAM